MSSDEPKMIHVQLPGGGTATVSATAAPETRAALDRLLQAAAASFDDNSTESEEKD